eukprot:3577508-Pleurochrysis_carterae.AAC.1
MGIPFRHALLVVFNLTSVFLFSGIIYGWAPLNSILISEDFYRHLCKPGDEVPCQEQVTNKTEETLSRPSLGCTVTGAATCRAHVAFVREAFVIKAHSTNIQELAKLGDGNACLV